MGRKPFGLAGPTTLHMTDFFWPKWHSLRSLPFQGPKKSRFQGPPLQTALIMNFPPSKSIGYVSLVSLLHLQLYAGTRYTLLTCLILPSNLQRTPPRQRGQIKQLHPPPTLWARPLAYANLDLRDGLILLVGRDAGADATADLELARTLDF